MLYQRLDIVLMHRVRRSRTVVLLNFHWRTLSYRADILLNIVSDWVFMMVMMWGRCLKVVVRLRRRRLYKSVNVLVQLLIHCRR